ncbi:ankyrin repeat and fibronectin type-III domain-containing protein 1 isoform X2 [Phycodurus eques]|uniref:ankyrin repeat and fibronectin type-III domain-containing protein 1 isoform X2 n=1 Tax=Phycodurus eques TaxID=693459 RepID=UPI002ACD3F80|nr:ankyrin repeat and fibronectin type-III domain-containing protein 1 isoform X2 [Phycodurus eques]
MSVDSENSCALLSSRDSRISCVFRAADEKDDVQAAGDESVLEMLSCSKFSDLETWLCMPSSLLLPPSPDSDSASASDRGDGDSERDGAFLAPALSKETPFLVTPLLPVLSSTPAAAAAALASHGAVGIRKRRRLAAGPGGLHWKSTGSPRSPEEEDEEGGPGDLARRHHPAQRSGAGERAAVRKTLSADERLLQPAGAERRHLKLLGRLERGRKKLRDIHSLRSPSRYDSRKKSDGKLARLAQRWNGRTAAGDALIRDPRPLFCTGIPRSSRSLDRRLPAVMTQQMQNLQLSQAKKVPGGPASPNAAKRLYRNLSEKLRGSTSSFEDAYFFGKTDRLRKASTMQGSECLLEAVEQQDADAVRILLGRFSAEELDLNTPDGRGLTALDVAVMTDDAPIAEMLLEAGAREGPRFVSGESREAHLAALAAEAERRAAELAARAQRDGLSLEACHKDKQLRAWEWRCKLYKRMESAFQHARSPEAPARVRLSVSSSSSLSVAFQEPRGLDSTVVTKYRVEWSCLKDFSLLAGEMLHENPRSLKCTIGSLSTGRLYYVRVSACNVRGWGPPACASPPAAAPSNWRESDGRKPRRHSHIEVMERLLQQVRATHSHYCCGDASKLQNPSRKQSVSRSLKHLFHSSNKFVKTLKRGIYLAAVFYHKDSLLVTAEDQIPIVEVDDSYGSSLMQDFLWFTKLSCMWEDVRWLRQSTSVSTSSSSTLQARHKMLSAAGQLQSLLGTHNLGRVHYEPIKDRHGNVLLVTVRDAEGQRSLFGGKWMQVAKLQSQRKSLSTPEEPYALDVLVITLQDMVAYQRRSTQRLAPGLYLGYLKLSSSVDQIRVLVSQRTPNMLCHVRVRENANVSREEWDWFRTLSAAGEDGEEARPESRAGHAPLLFYELQMAIESLLKNLNLPLHQARHFRLYSQEVVELGHGVCFLLLLPAADDVCSAPGQSNPYAPLSGFLHLPLQMFELVHFCTYKEKFISLYCRLSSVLDLDGLITQQALREAITDGEVAGAKTRHRLILDYVQQLDETRRDLRWLTDALQYARYKHPRGGVPVTCLVDAGAPESEDGQQKTDSTSSAMDYPPSPSPELRRRKAISDSLPGSDEDGCSEVFLPTDSDYDSSDALSPRELDLLYSPPRDLSRQAVHSLGGSAPDVLQIHELRYSTPPVRDRPRSPALREPKSKDGTAPFPPHSSSVSIDSAASPSALPRSPSLPRAPHLSPSAPLPPRFSGDPPPSSPLCPALCHTTETLEGLSLSRTQQEGGAPQLRPVPNPPSKRKLLSKSHRGQYFSGPQRRLRGHSGESHTGSLSEGVYTEQRDPDPPPPPASHGATYVSRTDCVLESREGRLRQHGPHVRRIFLEAREELEGAGAAAAAGSEGAGEDPEGAAGQDVDSDDQTNAQVSEILSSTL